MTKMKSMNEKRQPKILEKTAQVAPALVDWNLLPSRFSPNIDKL
jgi:hypothetical protein